LVVAHSRKGAGGAGEWPGERAAGGWSLSNESKDFNPTESLILAQDERWRCALYMQVVRERPLRGPSRAANGCVTREQPALKWGITPRNRG
jgi:hypothetical protein